MLRSQATGDRFPLACVLVATALDADIGAAIGDSWVLGLLSAMAVAAAADVVVRRLRPMLAVSGCC